jgi:hypothetical protein
MTSARTKLLNWQENKATDGRRMSDDGRSSIVSRLSSIVSATVSAKTTDGRRMMDDGRSSIFRGGGQEGPRFAGTQSRGTRKELNPPFVWRVKEGLGWHIGPIPLNPNDSLTAEAAEVAEK